MSTSPPDRSLDLLAGRVFDIPEPQFADLVRSLEARRLKSEQRATADAVLSRLRPRMSMARPPRRPTPQRLFCLPFEDLLYDPGTPRKAIGRIPRSAIAPIWSLFVERAPPGTVEKVAATLRSAEPTDTTMILDAGTPLWAEGALVLKACDAASRKTADSRTRLRDHLGGEPVLASLEDVAMTLGIALPLLRLRAALPPAPIETVGKDGIAALVSALQEVAAVDRAALPHVIFVLMARLRDLGQIAEIIDRLIKAGVGDLLQHASGQVGEAVVSQTEDRLIDVRAGLSEEELPKADVARALGREVDSLERAAAAIGGGGRALTRRIDRVKGELNRIAREIVVSGADAAALDAISALDAAGAAEADELRNLREAEDRIVGLRLCKRISNDPETAEMVTKALAKIAQGLDDRGKAILRRLETDDPTVSVADLYNTVRLVELVEGPEKADKLRVAGRKAITGKD